MSPPTKRPAPAQDRPSANNITYATNRNPLRARRHAADRVVPLSCGCRDPWSPSCGSSDELTTKEVDGYRDAVVHLGEHGLTAAARLPELRALWHRGGPDRRLAQRIVQCWEVSA